MRGGRDERTSDEERTRDEKRTDKEGAGEEEEGVQFACIDVFH